MLNVRALEQEDLPAIAALRRRVFSHSRWQTQGELEAYMRRLLFESPWRDEELPSWVAEGAAGEILGFIGILPRPMTVAGRPVRGAVATQFMTAPEHRGVAGVKVLMRAFAGRQDVLFTDVATTTVRQLWERAGGARIPLYSFGWRRTVRPLRSALRTSSRRGLRRTGALLQQASGVAGKRRTASGVQEVTPRGALSTLTRLTADGRTAAVYTPETLEWVFAAAQQKWSPLTLQMALVHDGHSDEAAGCFIHGVDQAGEMRVLQMCAAGGAEHLVLTRVIEHARAIGALNVSGRMFPSFTDAFDACGCQLNVAGNGVLVQAPDPALLTAVLRGRTELGVLEGEWWMDF